MSHVDEGTLHAYLDGELPAAERAQLEAHLAECTACRDRLTEERGLIERADRLLTLAELPAGHSHRSAPAPVQSLRRRPRVMVPAAWAASIALAFLTGWLLRPAPVTNSASDERYAGFAATTPVDSPQPALARDTAGPATLYRTPPEHRLAAKPTWDSAVTTGNFATAKAVVPGVVGTPARPTLRGAAPAPIPPATVAITPSAGAPQTAQTARAADVAMEPSRRRSIGTTWTAISAEPARRVLGTEVARIPGLPVRDILQNANVPNEVMVEQEVADGTIIQLLQSPLDSTVRAMAYAYVRDPLQKAVGHLQVRISGPLATDSLLKLLDRVR